MAVEIRPYTDDLAGALAAFNTRLRDGGRAGYQFKAQGVDSWLPRLPGRSLYRQYYAAVEDGSTLRGGFVLKHQEFLIDGQIRSIADLQFPVSEGIVNRKYAPLAGRLMREATRLQPCLFGLGMGGYDQAVARLFKAAGWGLFTVPFYFRVGRPFRFLRNIVVLRRSPLRRALLDALAFTGLGWVAVKVRQAMVRKPAVPARPWAAEAVDSFGPWADEIWEAGKGQYVMVAVRTSDILNILYPAGNPCFVRLKVSVGDKAVGWAVVIHAQMSHHRQFGNMRVGSIVDGFAAAGDEPAVACAAAAHLRRLGVDLIVSNQAHEAWRRGLEAAGLMQGPSNFIFGGSQVLWSLIGPLEASRNRMHLNRGDGDGPIHL